MNNTAQSPLSRLLDPELLSELKLIELRARKNVNNQMSGQYRTAFRSSGLIFSDLREYQPGDEVKNIHWKASARTGRVYVKDYEEDRQLNIFLAVDISASTDFGRVKSKHTKALEFAALLTVLAMRNGDAIGLCLFSDEVEEFIPAKQGRNQFKRIVASLLNHRHLKPATDIKAALHYLKQHLKRRSVIFLVSDFISPDFEQELKVLTLRHDLICVSLEDQNDTEFPKVGIVEFIDAENGQRLLIDTSHRKFSSALSKLIERRISTLENSCSYSGADLIRVSTNPLKPLSDLMNRRAKRFR